MTPELKAKWLSALRSGNYKQGESFLHWDDTYCCLGVLCDVAQKEWQPHHLTEHVVYAPDGNNGDQGQLEEHLLTEFGVPVNIHAACILMNDNAADDGDVIKYNIKQGHHTFPEIADWLEQNL